MGGAYPAMALVAGIDRGLPVVPSDLASDRLVESHIAEVQQLSLDDIAVKRLVCERGRRAGKGTDRPSLETGLEVPVTGRSRPLDKKGGSNEAGHQHQRSSEGDSEPTEGME